ncbi:MAG: 16S rRNA (cytosine(1402)-N(4))-methyltransferase RsmH [Cryomorphaceae bacterium]
MNRDEYHNPVLLHPSVEGLIADKNGIYVDATFGGGGHSREVLSRLSSSGSLIGFDQDQDAAKNAPDDKRFRLIQNNFRYLKNNLRFLGISKIDGLLADLGVSSHQFNAADRGFSIRGDAKLDMRMSKTAEVDAVTVVNDYPEEDLAKVFWEYGELRNARTIAGKIAGARAVEKIQTTEQLMDVIGALAPKPKWNQFMARVFQAIRIEVNQEMEALKELLIQSGECLKPGGKLVVISYHSLEDRLVKRYMKAGNFEGDVARDFYGNQLRPFTPDRGMPIVPGKEEIELNNRARSAKLRIATRNGDDHKK